MSEVDRDEAWRLFCEWTESESLRKHVLGVEAAMVEYAPDYDGDESLWAATGILHDLDYEKFPDMDAADGHPRTALRVLQEKGYPDELIDAVAGHAEFLNHPRTTPLAKTLFAVDELSGFIAACALVRPTGIVGLTPKSVKKKLKTPAFAAAVDREQMRKSAEDLGVDFDEHIQRVISAMEARADALGLLKEPSDHPS
jgi:putative nucleotidyltransferase with HDIG domain